MGLIVGEGNSHLKPSASRFWKRALDVAIAVGGLLILGPALLAIAVLVKVTSAGPALYRGERVGKDGRPFRIYKIRTMVGTADRGAAITSHGDPRITALGRVLRSTKFDEVPQLLNVLRGDMSIVGPRPEHPSYVAQYTREQRQILSVKPGITSPASIAFYDEEQALPPDDAEDTYRSIVLPTKLNIDLKYVQRQSLAHDLAIIIKTLGLLFPRQLVFVRRLLTKAIRIRVPWIAIDAPLVAVGFYAALQFRFAETSPADLRAAMASFIVSLPFLVLLYSGMNYAFRLHRRTWRYATASEVMPILGAAVASTVISVLVDLSVGAGRTRPLPLSVVLVGGFFSFCGFVLVRYRTRLMPASARWNVSYEAGANEQTRALIYGAGESGQLLAWRMLTQKELQGYRVVGFVDDDPATHKMRIHGIKVLGGRHQLASVIERERIDLVILTMKARGEEIRSIFSAVQATPAQIKIAPNLFDWIAGTNGPLLREVRVADLVGRPPATIDWASCKSILGNRVVLVTGACGSIGSELSRQIAAFHPRVLLALDNNESGLYELQVEMKAHLPELNLQVIVADVTDEGRVEQLFRENKPDVIFHVAAYKHVPLMEQYPEEAVRVNVGGTRVVLNKARQHATQRFVLVSTDKAVKPTSVMGATKRLAEMLVTNGNAGGAENAGPSDLLCTAVRFGNVLGSRGSVVPTFAKQIELGGPVTVTHQEMTRYFMDLGEAASLIIQAASLTRGCDIFMLDMGERIRIDDLARRMIRMRGLRPEIDIPIEYVGVRPGEKLHEELIYPQEARQLTDRPFIYSVNGHFKADAGALDRAVDSLLALAALHEREPLVKLLLGLSGLSELSGPNYPETIPIGSADSAATPTGGLIRAT